MYVNQDILTIYVNVFVFVKMMMTRRMLQTNDKKIIRLDKMKSYAEAAQHKPNLLIYFFLSLSNNERLRVNFTKILRAAFTLPDPNSAKKDSQVKQLFALMGSAVIIPMRKTH